MYDYLNTPLGRIGRPNMYKYYLENHTPKLTQGYLQQMHNNALKAHCQSPKKLKQRRKSLRLFTAYKNYENSG